MKSILLKLWMILLAFSVLSAFADIASTQTQIVHDQDEMSSITLDQYEKLSIDQQKSLAAIWGLSVTDYDHYLNLMKNTVNGVYYQNAHLDPSWILGFNASNDQERKKFAVIAIQNERVRVAKELAFQREFQQLQFALYPNEKPIAWPTIQQNKLYDNNSLQAGDSLLLFTNLQNHAVDSVVGHLISLIQSHSGTQLNLYFVGSSTDNDIRRWAAQHAIPENLVKNGIITLNHDDGRFGKLSQGKSQLPLVVLNKNGQKRGG